MLRSERRFSLTNAAAGQLLISMFVREKRINGYTYLYLVETVREDGRAKQRIIKNLGRKEALAASGALERLASSVARYAERAVVLSQILTEPRLASSLSPSAILR